jgi:organic radical activating enzyme
MSYFVAERFKSIQGEGVFAGTPMAFIRFVGCSVGKTICQHCDTDFDKTMPWRGGGEYSLEHLIAWIAPHEHCCLTGGEPLDQELFALIKRSIDLGVRCQYHIETSGTIDLSSIRNYFPSDIIWICVSPKPGFHTKCIDDADEIKVIVPGLGNGEGWPQLNDALRWANHGRTVFLQPRNAKMDVNRDNLMYVMDLVREYPQLRLSVQMHKLLKVQ